MSGLSSLDVMKLCKELLKHAVISKAMSDSFATLDHDNLDAEVRIRYLLLHVSDKVREEGDYLDNFLKVLLVFGLSDASQIVRENIQVWSFLNNPDTLGGMILSDRDVFDLTEVIIEGSHKWKEIGLSLKLLEYEIEECGKGGSNTLNLSNILRRWLTNSKSTKPPTLDDLSCALANEVVGRTDLADKLVQKFSERSEKYKTLKLQSKSSHRNFLLIKYQSVDVKVVNGKSALLEVRVEPNDAVNYQWRKDGRNVFNNDVYSYVNNAILFISSINLKAEGYYSCCISRDGIEVYSNDITLAVTFPQITRYFFDIYSRLDELPEDCWPPVAATTFINLALITKSKSDSNMYDYTVQGDIDDIIETKEKIEYEELFGEYESGALLLIEGRPGSGKTTLMHKVTRDWAVKKNVLVGAKLVVLVPLRLFSSFSKDLELSDIVKNYIVNKNNRQEVLSHVEECDGNGVCFIVDGLDEYQFRDNKETTIYKLLHKTFLPQSMVIVASRPIGSAKLRKGKLKAPVTMRVEILGFSKLDIFSYIESYSFDDVSIASKLKTYLSIHSRVLHMCYLPVYTAMICYLYSQLGDDIPQTETKTYEHFTLLTIVRKLKSEDDEVFINFNSIFELEGDLKSCFNKICELAYIMTVNSKQAIHQRDADISLSSQGSDGPSLNLVTIDCSAKLFNIEDFYTFLHLTFQEYLAALHIAGLDDYQQLEIIDLYKNKPEFLMVWRFFCGTVNFIHRKLQIKRLLYSSNMDTCSKVMCGFESQQQVVCDLILVNNTLSFKDQSFRTSDFLAISYVILNSNNNLTKLVFDECKLDKEGIILLIEQLSSDHFERVNYLGHHKKNCTVLQLKVLNKVLRKLHSLQSLNLERTNLGSIGITELTADIKLPYLRFLKVNLTMKTAKLEVLEKLKFLSNELQQVEFGCSESKNTTEEKVKYYSMLYNVFGGCVYWNPMYSMVNNMTGHIRLEHSSRCHELILVNCCIEDHHLRLLVPALKTYNILRNLILDFNQISGKGAKLLASSFKLCTTIEVFSAHCNQIDDSGALTIAKAFAQLRNPRILDLQCNAITKMGSLDVTRVTENLVSNPEFKLYITTQTTNLSSSSFSYVNMKSLKSSLQTIWKGSLQAKVNAFKCCKFVSGIYITDTNDGELRMEWPSNNIVALADGLKFCNNALILKLVHKSIVLKAALALADALKYYTNLKILILHSNSICSDGAVALASAIKRCTSLEELDLDFNSISSDGAVALADALKYCTNLEILGLDSNDIHSDGAVALAGSLKCCTNLEMLSLNNNDIGSDGAVALAGFMKCCTNLEILNLDSNDIGSDGAVAIAGSLKCCTNLEMLSLDSNDIGSDGAVALAGSLKCCTNLEILSLDSNDIGSDGAVALAGSLKCCTNLEILSLDSNDIGSDGAIALASSLKCCTNLEILCLDSNDIGSDGAGALAGALRCCTNLKEILLDDNNIRSYGVVVLAGALKLSTNLEILSLDSNDIGSDGALALAGSLKCCTNLEILSLDSNDIGSDGAVALAGSLKCCTNLEILSLDSNDIGSDGAVALAGSLKCCTNLKYIWLDGNSIGSYGAVALASALKYCSSLERLGLKRSSMETDGAVALADSLKCCINLEDMDLDSNNIGSDGVIALAGALKYCTNLKKLCLCFNHIGSDGAVALASALKSCTNLEMLSLDSNHIGPNGAEALSSALKYCTNLKKMCLCFNHIGTYGAVALASALKSCTNLEILSLDSNHISPNGAVALASALKSCTNLEILSLDSNHIGPNGAEALSSALKYCTNLKKMCLCFNHIGSDGAVALASALKFCTNLEILSLDSNHIGPNGAVALASALKSCTNLEILSLDSNLIGPIGAVALSNALKCCTNLKKLCLCFNHIGSDGAVALASALKYCTSLNFFCLSFNHIGSDGAVALASALKCCTNLEILSLDSCHFGSDSVILKYCFNLEIFSRW